MAEEQVGERGWAGEETPAPKAEAAVVAARAREQVVSMLLPAGPNREERLAKIIAVRDARRNALMEAAGPLLRCLAEVPDELAPAEVLSFNQLLHQEVGEFTRLCEQANLRRDHMLATRYVLCTALDEVISQRPWGGGSRDSTGSWSQMALLNRFHGESQGGNTVFLLIGRLANAQDEHIHILEIIHHVLCLGFKGEYRTKPEGPRQLETIRHRLYTMISGAKPPLAHELSPHWKGVGKGRFKLLRAVPVWASASLLGLILFGMFSWYKIELYSKSSAIRQQIESLSRLQAPPPQPLAVMGIAQLLAPEISRGLLRVDESDSHADITLRGDGMFNGLVNLSEASTALLEKIGVALSAMTGEVQIIGHTDNQPIHTPEFPSNKELSLARARQVAMVLQRSGVDAKRMVILGMGDTQPLNGNAANRAANRRVEIKLLADAKSQGHGVAMPQVEEK